MAEAIASVGGLCLDNGGQRCMRPCRLMWVSSTARGWPVKPTSGTTTPDGSFQRLVDSPIAQGTDGSIDLVYRWLYNEEGRLERLEEWIPNHPMVPSRSCPLPMVPLSIR